MLAEERGTRTIPRSSPTDEIFCWFGFCLFSPLDRNKLEGNIGKWRNCCFQYCTVLSLYITKTKAMIVSNAVLFNREALESVMTVTFSKDNGDDALGIKEAGKVA